MSPSLRALKHLLIFRCINLRYVEGIGSLLLLEELEIVNCPELSLLGNLQPLPSLKTLEVRECTKLTTAGGAGEARDDQQLSFKGELIIDDPLLLSVLLEEQGLNSLQQLIIGTVDSEIEPFGEKQEDMFICLPSLSHLIFRFCSSLPCLPGSLEKLSSLQKLEIDYCSNIQSLPVLPSSLKLLEIGYCGHMKSLANLPTSLQSLKILFCRQLEALPIFPPSLQLLELSSCDNMKSLPDSPTSLQSLEILHCDNMESLPELPAFLQSLSIHGCHPQVYKNYEKGGPLHHKIAHIPNLFIH